MSAHFFAGILGVGCWNEYPNVVDVLADIVVALLVVVILFLIFTIILLPVPVPVVVGALGSAALIATW